MKTKTPEAKERTWLVDDIVCPEHALIELARDYGYRGTNPTDAVKLLRAWEYQVEEQKP